MKKSSNSLFNYLSYAEIIELTKEVKENIAPVNNHATKPFSSADLWNIQRQTKYRTQRRFL